MKSDSRLNFSSLEERRLRGFKLQVLKNPNKFGNVDHSKLLQFQTNPRTKNNGLPLKVRSCITDSDRIFFSNRVIIHWNNLPIETADENCELS